MRDASSESVDSRWRRDCASPSREKSVRRTSRAPPHQGWADANVRNADVVTGPVYHKLAIYVKVDYKEEAPMIFTVSSSTTRR